MDERVAYVAAWLAYQFRKFPRQFRWELEWAAKAEGIDLSIWMSHPTILALGLQRHQHVCPWLGQTAWETWCGPECSGEDQQPERRDDGDV